MTPRTKVLTGPHRGLPISTHMPKRLTWLCIEWCYLTRDYAHDHWLGRADKDMMQSHCPEEPVRSRQAGIGVHNKGCALHERPQVDIHVPLLISQVPAVTTMLQKAPHHQTLALWPSEVQCKQQNGFHKCRMFPAAFEIFRHSVAGMPEGVI